MLRHLGARGVPVPEALELRRSARGWEVVMTAVVEARSLEELLRDGHEPQGGWKRLLAELGRALARIQATRANWRDVHLGNVLVDAAGKPWLIDFHQASWRILSGRDRKPLDVLAHVAALGREHFPARRRLCFLAAWRRERIRQGEPVPRFDAALLAALEERARRERRRLVERGSGRWLRESSRVCVTRTASGILIERKEPARNDLGAPLVLAGLSRKEAEARWLHAARIEEHGLPVLRPLRLELTRAQGSLALERTTLARPLPPGEPHENLGLLRALLHDRGLDVERLRPEELVPLPSGGYGFLPPRELHAIDPLPAGPSRFAATVQETRSG